MNSWQGRGRTARIMIIQSKIDNGLEYPYLCKHCGWPVRIVYIDIWKKIIMTHWDTQGLGNDKRCDKMWVHPDAGRKFGTVVELRDEDKARIQKSLDITEVKWCI